MTPGDDRSIPFQGGKGIVIAGDLAHRVAELVGDTAAVAAIGLVTPGDHRTIALQGGEGAAMARLLRCAAGVGGRNGCADQLAGEGGEGAHHRSGCAY